MGPGELIDEKPARGFGGTCPVPVLDESQRAAAKPWVILFAVAFFGRMLLPIIAIIAVWAGWVSPKSATLFAVAGYIVSQYTVMLARCALSRIEGTDQPSWFRAIAMSAVLAIFGLFTYLT